MIYSPVTIHTATKNETKQTGRHGNMKRSSLRNLTLNKSAALFFVFDYGVHTQRDDNLPMIETMHLILSNNIFCLITIRRLIIG